MLRKQKISKVTRLQGELLRDEKIGHPDWYAEMLVCAALDGQLALTNNPDYDINCKKYGKVQVKCRVNGTGGTQNRTNFKRYKEGAFDHAAIVIFESDYRIKGAVILPFSTIVSIIRPAGHVTWQDASTHQNSVDIKSELTEISGENQTAA